MARDLFLLKELVKRDFQGRYAGSVLGFLWSLLQPLWTLILFTFVFSTVMKISLVGERTESFAVFLFAGLLPWLAVHEGVLRSATAITDSADLVKKLRFPSQILVLAVVVAALLHQLIALGVFLVILAATGALSWVTLPLLIPAMALQTAIALGLGLLLAALHVFFRDIQQILGMVFNAWFYLTPIVYPLDLVPDSFVGFLHLNPLTPLVGLYRHALLGPPGWPPWPPLIGLTVFAVLLLGLGGWVFRRLRGAFVDEI
ncbi:MAG: ABC transporter permease [Acidobacteriota bacterium]